MECLSFLVQLKEMWWILVCGTAFRWHCVIYLIWSLQEATTTNPKWEIIIFYSFNHLPLWSSIPHWLLPRDDPTCIMYYPAEALPWASQFILWVLMSAKIHSVLCLFCTYTGCKCWNVVWLFAFFFLQRANILYE